MVLCSCGFRCRTSLARGKSVRNHLHTSVTSISRAVHGPHTGAKLENFAQLSDTGFLRFWDHRRLVDSRMESWGFPIGSHMGHRPMSNVRALKGPVWVPTAPYGSACKTTGHVRSSCGPRTDSVQCLEIRTGPARTVTTDYVGFGLHTDVDKPVRHPQRPVRCLHVHSTEPVTIPKNIDNPQNARMHVTIHIG